MYSDVNSYCQRKISSLQAHFFHFFKIFFVMHHNVIVFIIGSTPYLPNIFIIGGDEDDKKNPLMNNTHSSIW